MKNVIFIFALFFLCISAQAQTKLISHKSHSGSKATFKTALDGNLFDIGASNFGNPYMPDYLFAFKELDSVVYVNDSIIFLYVKSWDDIGVEDESVSSIDTLINHPLFSQKDDLQNIKQKIRSHYEFRNEIFQVKFIGYDDELPEGEKANLKSPEEIKMTPQQSYTPLDIEEPKECTKPVEKEKVEKPTNQAPNNNNRTSFEIKKEVPKPVFVATHTTEIVKEASIIKESKSSSNIFIAISGIALMSVLLGFLFLKKD